MFHSVLYYLLLSRGADVTVKNDGEKTAGDICEDKDLKQVLKDLQRRKTRKSFSKRTRSKQKGFKAYVLKTVSLNRKSSDDSEHRTPGNLSEN